MVGLTMVAANSMISPASYSSTPGGLACVFNGWLTGSLSSLLEEEGEGGQLGMENPHQPTSLIVEMSRLKTIWSPDSNRKMPVQAFGL